MDKPPIRPLPGEFPGAIWYGPEERDAVLRVLEGQSPFRYYGPRCGEEVRQFEAECARYLASVPGESTPAPSSLYVTAVNSGTGALEVALDALGVGPGDEVCVQGFMWISSISAIVRQHAIPVLVDSDGTLNMDPYALRAAITPRTKVVMPVPMLGGCARIGAIMDVIREVNQERAAQGYAPVRVLEDCAQAFGAHANGAPGSIEPLAPESVYRVGTFGDAGIFSLQINKDITAGEGGMIVTRDPALHRRIDALHNAGYAQPEDGAQNWYGDVPIGWGHGRRMSEWQGAVGRAQLGKLDAILTNMRRSHGRFETRLRELGCTPRARADVHNPGDTGYYCCFHLPGGPESRPDKIALGRRVAAALEPWGIHPWFLHDFEVHVYYNIEPLTEKRPMNNGAPWDHPLNAFHTQYDYRQGALPVLDELLVTTVGINVPSKLTEEDEDHVLRVLEYVLAEEGVV